MSSADLQRSLESNLKRRLSGFDSPEYSLKWKEWDIALGPPICALRASARRISDKDFIGWPISRAADGTGHQPGQRYREDGTPMNDALTTVASLAGWPTPKAQEDGRTMEQFQASRLRCYENRKGKSAGGPSSKQGGLAISVQLAGWASPTVFCSNENLVEKERRRQEAKEKHGRIFGKPLAESCHLAGWPTTTTRDSKGTDAPNRAGAPSLCEVARGAILKQYFVPTGKPVALAAAFSRWLMGYPESWDRASPHFASWQAAIEMVASREAETQ